MYDAYHTTSDTHARAHDCTYRLHRHLVACGVRAYLSVLLACMPTTGTDVDRALFNSLRVRFELGLFDPVQDQPYWTYTLAKIGSESSR
jgi:hypothetical protein